MGEEKKEEAVEEKKEEVKEEKKEEEKKKKDGEEEEKEKEKEIILKVDMHCEACARKVARSLKGFQGVEEVKADCKASRVVVKGKGADPVKVSQRITKKSGRKVEIISPLPKNKEEGEKEEEDDKKKKQEENKDPQPKPDNKQEPPPVITVVLKVRMHCEACAQGLQKKIRKVKGVESVTTDISNDRVIVKGVLDPEKLVNDVYKRTGKQASIVKDEEKKKEEEKKEEEKKDSEEKKKESEENKEEDDDKKTDIKKMEHWPSKYYMEHYSYAPQMFSDENPNACVVM